MSEDAHIDPVDVNEDVAFGQVLAARTIQDRLDFLAVGAVGDGEAEAHGALGDLHRHQLRLASGHAPGHAQ